MVAVRSDSLAKWLRVRVRAGVRVKARGRECIIVLFSLVLQNVMNIFAVTGTGNNSAVFGMVPRF